MIRTALSIERVPSTWIFEHYCKLQTRLHGQDVKIKSIFNESDTNPSMVIFYSTQKQAYVFKDFSSGKGGDAVSLVASMFNMPYNAAISKIIDDYDNRDAENYDEVVIQERAKFKVTSHKTRKWNEFDAKYWTQFGIGSSLLGKYNVRPLASYEMTRESEEGGTEAFGFDGHHIYGYFKDSGELYKIYQPKRLDYKFLNVSPYIQGSEQLTYSKPTLVICSSLKDVMALDALKLDVEAVAPSSETSMLPKSVLSAYTLKYEKIMTLFDNDEAGHRAMNKYHEQLSIPGIFLRLSKDLSDSVRDYGITKTRTYLKPLIHNA